ncbi:hypothetical protein Purlil1_1452 [Purpureocillium lilacinum]|uniref:Uncharacterized protein n=1 Tax=Purpureocillium lilacinum TaxID=33203 RepID=A0ABR0CDH5_PURLI|nr:hypothetical protein Purlil1_1452 [Purpureocillium lilacinum]
MINFTSLPTSLPSFPSTWTAPTSCFASTNYYRVLLGSGYVSNMYGTPTPVFTGNYPTGDCWPPSSTKGVPYLTTGDCPPGFTRACATAGPESRGKLVSTVTCCPSVTGNVFSFMCKDNEYGCHATATSGAVWTGVITDIGLDTPTEAPVTRTPYLNEGLEAWGIKLISVAPPSTTAPTLSTTVVAQQTDHEPSTTAIPSGGQEPPSEQRRLRTGAIVGISIGVIIAVSLLGLAFLVVVRARRTRHTQSASTSANSYTEGPECENTNETDARYAARFLHSRDAPKGPTWELPG